MPEGTFVEGRGSDGVFGVTCRGEHPGPSKNRLETTKSRTMLDEIASRATSAIDDLLRFAQREASVIITPILSVHPPALRDAYRAQLQQQVERVGALRNLVASLGAKIQNAQVLAEKQV